MELRSGKRTALPEHTPDAELIRMYKSAPEGAYVYMCAMAPLQILKCVRCDARNGNLLLVLKGKAYIRNLCDACWWHDYKEEYPDIPLNTYERKHLLVEKNGTNRVIYEYTKNEMARLGL